MIQGLGARGFRSLGFTGLVCRVLVVQGLEVKRLEYGL